VTEASVGIATKKLPAAEPNRERQDNREKHGIDGPQRASVNYTDRTNSDFFLKAVASTGASYRDCFGAHFAKSQTGF
jgi:hypothetical protein